MGVLLRLKSNTKRYCEATIHHRLIVRLRRPCPLDPEIHLVGPIHLELNRHLAAGLVQLALGVHQRLCVAAAREGCWRGRCGPQGVGAGCSAPPPLSKANTNGAPSPQCTWSLVSCPAYISGTTASLPPNQTNNPPARPPTATYGKLVVGVVLRHHDVEHGAGVGHLEDLAVLVLELFGGRAR